jgi:hypothetical protein
LRHQIHLAPDDPGQFLFQLQRGPAGSSRRPVRTLPAGPDRCPGAREGNRRSGPRTTPAPHLRARDPLPCRGTQPRYPVAHSCHRPVKYLTRKGIRDVGRPKLRRSASCILPAIPIISIE